MQNLISDLINILERDQTISRKQLLALKYFLLREREFAGFTTDDLINFFSPIIKTKTNAKSEQIQNAQPKSSLSCFFQD